MAQYIEKMLKKQQRLQEEIEQHFGKSAHEVANDPVLSKDPFFVERDKEYSRLESIINTELF